MCNRDLTKKEMAPLGEGLSWGESPPWTAGCWRGGRCAGNHVRKGCAAPSAACKDVWPRPLVLGAARPPQGGSGNAKERNGRRPGPYGEGGNGREAAQRGARRKENEQDRERTRERVVRLWFADMGSVCPSLSTLSLYLFVFSGVSSCQFC